MTDLLALAARVEAATGADQCEMLDLAFFAIHGPKPERILGGSPELTAWIGLRNPFFRMLDAQAFESAAMTLIPRGWFTSDFHQGPSGGNWWSLSYIPDGAKLYTKCPGSGKTPALALTAACLRAIAQGVEA